jgi:hypothetical protein
MAASGLVDRVAKRRQLGRIAVIGSLSPTLREKAWLLSAKLIEQSIRVDLRVAGGDWQKSTIKQVFNE